MHELATTEQFLRVLDGFPAAFPAGEKFFYCNGGFVVLALLAERASGVPFHDLVRQRVCRPAGLVDTDFLRSDALPGRAALGYVELDGEWRTNVFHLPVLGTGDRGVVLQSARPGGGADRERAGHDGGGRVAVGQGARDAADRLISRRGSPGAACG